MNKNIICMMVVLASIVGIVTTNVQAQESVEVRRNVYVVNPGESYVLDAFVTTKDGKRKKVTLTVRVPHNQSPRTNVTANPAQSTESLVAPNVGNDLPNAIPDDLNTGSSIDGATSMLFDPITSPLQ